MARITMARITMVGAQGDSDSRAVTYCVTLGELLTLSENCFLACYMQVTSTLQLLGQVGSCTMHRLYQLQNTNVKLSLPLQQAAGRACTHREQWETLTRWKRGRIRSQPFLHESWAKRTWLQPLNLLQWALEIWSTKHLPKELQY